MSQENVEVVRSLVEAWNRGDYSVVSESTDPEIEVEAALGGTFDGTYRGIAEARNFLEDFWRNFEQSHTDVTEYIPVGDSVIFEAHLRGRGRAAALRWRCGTGSCAPCATEGWSPIGCSPRSEQPSKPLGCRSSAVCAATLVGGRSRGSAVITTR
jgi:hypothetical protein